MADQRRRLLLCGVSALMLLFASGCRTFLYGTVKNMEVMPSDWQAPTPEEGKSMVVFMRPAGLGGGVSSSIFDVKENEYLLAGILSAKYKVAYQLEPGEHLFMVVSENADFMSANLEANKTYYAIVTPRMGAWKARFSLAPIHKEEIGSAQFDEWSDECEWVTKIPASEDWAKANMPSIQSKHKKYHKVWMDKDESSRPRLLPQDGR